jgi:hypothetical protein
MMLALEDAASYGPKSIRLKETVIMTSQVPTPRPVPALDFKIDHASPQTPCRLPQRLGVLPFLRLHLGRSRCYIDDGCPPPFERTDTAKPLEAEVGSHRSCERATYLLKCSQLFAPTRPLDSCTIQSVRYVLSTRFATRLLDAFEGLRNVLNKKQYQN